MKSGGWYWNFWKDSVVFLEQIAKVYGGFFLSVTKLKIYGKYLMFNSANEILFLLLLNIWELIIFIKKNLYFYISLLII